MSNELDGVRVAFLVNSSGVEQAELTQPWQAVVDAGGEPVLVAPETGQVQAFNHDVEEGDTFTADLAVGDAKAEDFAGVVIPGGTTNADHLRMVEPAVALVEDFVGAGKPVASICHGPWVLVEAGVLGGKTLTSFPSLATDVRNAGGTWVDEEVHVCPTDGWPLVTSRTPDDLDAFSSALVEQLAKSAR